MCRGDYSDGVEFGLCDVVGGQDFGDGLQGDAGCLAVWGGDYSLRLSISVRKGLVSL
jgi:hypothetical protein